MHFTGPGPLRHLVGAGSMGKEKFQEISFLSLNLARNSEEQTPGSLCLGFISICCHQWIIYY